MERRELAVYSAADATVTVSGRDASWVRRHVRASAAAAAGSGQQLGGAFRGAGSRLAVVLPFVAYPPPPRRARTRA